MFTGPAPKEKKEMSSEQFREEMKRAQQALAQLQKEEGQAKKNDYSLADVIIQFLNRTDSTDLFLLISRSVAQDIPSELILAVLSLVDKKASEEISSLLKSGKGSESVETKALTVAESSDFKSLSPDQKKDINKWIENINKVASKRPHLILENLIIKERSDTNQEIREISPAFVQLSAFILRNYLESQKTVFEFEQIHEFMQSVFVALVKNLEKLVADQKQIDSNE